MTYGQLAAAATRRSARRGRAMAACPSGRGIPWHRVVGAGGRLLLREPNVWMQRRLLETEGVEVAERRIDLQGNAWLEGENEPRGQTPARKGELIRANNVL